MQANKLSMQIFEKLTHNGIFRSGRFSGFAHCAQGNKVDNCTKMFKILLAQTKKMQVKIQCSAVCRRNGNKKSFANYKNKD